MAGRKPYRYAGRCDDFPGQGAEIMAMDAAATGASYAELAQHTPLRTLERKLGYGGERFARGPRAGERNTLENDPLITYGKSTFQGRPCYFIKHSAYHHIFVLSA